MIGNITRVDTDWKGQFCISYIGAEEGPRTWLPSPSIIKSNTEVAYYETLWKCDPFQYDDSPLPLGITEEDVISDSDWLDCYCREVYSGIYYFPTENHLNLSVKAYEKFLFLVAKYPQLSQQFSPSFSIDLIWRAHQLHPVEYQKDCKDLFGFELPYNATYYTSENQMNQTLTEKIWTSEFIEKIYKKLQGLQ